MFSVGLESGAELRGFSWPLGVALRLLHVSTYRMTYDNPRDRTAAPGYGFAVPYPVALALCRTAHVRRARMRRAACRHRVVSHGHAMPRRRGYCKAKYSTPQYLLLQPSSVESTQDGIHHAT